MDDMHHVYACVIRGMLWAQRGWGMIIELCEVFVLR